MLNIMLITTAIMPQFIYSLITFNDCISMVGLQLQPVVLYYIMLQCSYILHIILSIMLMRKLVPHFAPSLHDYYITNKDCYIKDMIRMSTNPLITFNGLH